jgi:hypothetical protein
MEQEGGTFKVGRRIFFGAARKTLKELAAGRSTKPVGCQNFVPRIAVAVKNDYKMVSL